jgi:hypothetical protein
MPLELPVEGYHQYPIKTMNLFGVVNITLLLMDCFCLKG